MYITINFFGNSYLITAQLHRLLALCTPVFKTHQQSICYNSDTYSIVAFLQLLSTDMNFWRSAARTSRLLKVRNKVMREKYGK